MCTGFYSCCLPRPPVAMTGPRGSLVAFVLALAACLLPTARSDTILIKAGNVVSEAEVYRADVLIEGEKIAAVGLDLQAEGAKVIDATGKYVMPGGIDPHTHLAMPFMGQVTCDDFYSGQAAALAGGTTMHIDFALPISHDLLKGWEEWKAKAENSVMDYGFHMAVTSWSDKVSHDMGVLTQEGINSFKFFMAYKGALMVNDEELLHGMRRCKELGALVQVHAENGDAVADGQKRMFEAGITGPEGHPISRPAILEAEATARAIRLARFANAPLYVVHVMSKDAAMEIASARAKGWRVIGEAVASALAFNESKVWDPDFKVAAQYVMSPPIRSEQDRQELKRHLAGEELTIVGTDHAVFNSTQKAVGRHDFRIIPNGVNGIEERMHVVWDEMVNSKLVDPPAFVCMTSAQAAKAFNIYPRKGLIAPGSDADVIVLDPDVRHVIRAATHHSAMDTNIYEGREVQGKVVTTISRGRLVWHNGVLDVAPGSGRFIPMATHGPIFEGLEEEDRQALARAFPYGPTPVRREERPASPEAAKDEL